MQLFVEQNPISSALSPCQRQYFWLHWTASKLKLVIGSSPSRPQTCAEFLCGLNEGSLVPDPDDGLLDLDVERLDGEGRVEGVSLLVRQRPEVRPSLPQLALFLQDVLGIGVIHVEELVSQLIHYVHLAGVDVHLRLEAREPKRDKGKIWLNKGGRYCIPKVGKY